MIISKEPSTRRVDKMGVYRQREQKQYKSSTIETEEKKEETARREMEGSQQEQQIAFLVDRLDNVTFYDAVPELTFASDCSSNSDGSKGRFVTDAPPRRLVSSERDSTGSLTSLNNGLPLTRTELSNVEDNNEVTNNLSPISSTAEETSVGTGSSRQRSISWGTVTTRKYPIIPGDHPDTYEGPPLTIDWNHVSESHTTVDEYEAKHGPRKREEELRLGWITRRQMLRRVGVSDDELREAQIIAKKGREQREATLSRLKFQKVEEIKQRLIRGLGRAFHPKKTLETRY